MNRSIKSVLDQTYQNIECLVIDDGSTDDTEEKVKNLMTHEPRLKYFKLKNGGQSVAKNFGIKQAQGEFIAFNDHDDAYLPEYVQKAVEAFRHLPADVAYLSGGVINEDEFGRKTYYLPQLEPFWKLSIGNGWVFRQSAFEKFGIHSDPSMSGFEDLDLHLQFRQHFRGYVIDVPLRLYFLRTRPSSSALSSSEYHKRFVRSFENFFTKYEKLYENQGEEAISWLCFFGGLVYMRASQVDKGRLFLKRSRQRQPSFKNILYSGFATFGYKPFLIFDNFKNSFMRVIRSLLLNRVP
ncbi:MAG: glycosyltransferase [Candidatus Liptonbacteria bacterium]|nr:glycosyltransferase [Candidatus Liptonbacteria bacterium]